MAARGGKSIWKVLIIAGVVCAVLVVAAGVLHTRAVTSAVEDRQKSSATYVRNTLTEQVAGVHFDKPLSDNQAKELGKSIDSPSGSTVVIYSLDGDPVYPSTAGKPDADEQDALSSAAKGHVANVEGHGALVVFAPIEDKNGAVAIAGVSTDESVVQADATGPLDAFKTPLMALAAVFVLAGIGLYFAGRSGSGGRKNKKGAPAGGATGFGAPAATQEAVAAPEKPKKSGGKRSLRTRVAAEDRGSDEERAGAHDREVAIRQALEDQLEQLRTALQTQDERAAAAVREIQAQLAAATKRADEAEARLATGAAEPQQEQPRDREMVERLRAMDAQLGQAKASANEASARAESLEAQLAALLATPTPTADTSGLEEQVRSLGAQLDEARRRAEQAEQLASESDQRARSVDSIRSDLEVRIAQLGSKAGELEQKASELEARLGEAHEGGDAVRAEIASLTSALAAANTRSEELERQAASAPDTSAAVEAAESETSRLRGELALHLERAQAAEERVAALQADLFAAQRGIEELPPEGSEAIDETDRPAYASTLDEHRSEPMSDRSEPVFAQTVATVEQAGAAPGASASASMVHDVTAAPAEREVEFGDTPAPATPRDEESYGDVWTAAYGAAVRESEPETEPEPEPEPAMQAREPEAAAMDHAPEPEEAVSPDDDLWALRERLARATEQAQQDVATDAPSWD